MSLISIKKYLDLAGSGDYRPTIDLVAEIATQHPIAFSPAQREQFRSDVTSILDRLSDPLDKEQFVTAVTAVSQALQSHNQSVASRIADQSVELQNMVVMLTQAIRSLGSASDISARNLEEIAVQLKQTATLEDVSRLRMRLSECLARLASETTRQKADTQRNLQSLNVKLAETQQRLAQHGMAADVDPVTGFAARRTAETAIHDVLASQESCYLVIAVLENMPAINGLFGYDIGDTILREFAAGLAAHLRSPAAIYRWRGPTIVGLLHWSEPIPIVRVEVGRAVAAAPNSKFIATQNRNAIVKATAASLILPVTPPAAELFSQIDEFVAARVPEAK
jgi:GGDEF domain-containing protein